MTHQKRSPFDLPVDGISDQYCTMPELMEQYRCAAASHDYERAYRVLDHTIHSGYHPAKLVMARFLKDTPQLEMPRRERYIRCERLYRDVLNSMELSARAAAALSAELAEFLASVNRPIGCLGALLKARRLGVHVHQQDIERCIRKIKRMDINSFCEYPQDCYDLGSELALSGSFQYAELFLRESFSSRNEDLAGRCCLLLAELYSAHGTDAPVYRGEALKMYRLAQEKGFPEYLTAPPRPRKQKKAAHWAV